MTTSTVRIPAHMNTDEYNNFVDSCYDEDIGYHNEGMLNQLEELIDLCLWIEDVSEKLRAVPFTDVSLDIELWEDEFVCKSGDIIFRIAQGKEMYTFGIMCTFFQKIGIASPDDIWAILQSQRRLEING